MKILSLFLTILILTGLTGCNIEFTSKLKEEIRLCQEDINHIKACLSELLEIDEDIMKLNQKLRKLKAEWKEIEMKYPDQVEQWKDKKENIY